MNQNYLNTRFKVVVPPEGIPSRFGIVTAHNPDGFRVSDAANEKAAAELRMELMNQNRYFFPVTGGSPDFSHAEEGFGIVMDCADQAVALGRQWRQEAVFWVEDGTVELWSCTTGKRTVVGPWHDLALES